MAKNTCVTCLWEKETGKKVDTSKSRVAWAEKIGVSEASVRRHLKHSPAANTPADEGDKFLSDLDLPEEIVTSRGKSVRLADGSWEKVTWQPNKKALLDALRYDDLKAALDGWTPITASAAPEAPWAAVFNMSDLQVGKAGARGGGTPELVERVRNSVDAFVQYLQDQPTRPETIVIADGGDSIENVFNVSEQIATNDLSVPEQIRVARRLFLEAIKAVIPYSDDIVYVSVPSNHGQFRTGFKTAGGTVDADFGLEISYQLEDALGENPHAGHVRFVRPEPLFETAELFVAGTRLAFNHGHRSGSQAGHSKWWSGQAHGRMPGWDADVMVLAHFHNLSVAQSGNARWIIGVSSPEAGSDWWANLRGERSTQGITAFNVSGGMWSDLRVL